MERRCASRPSEAASVIAGPASASSAARSRPSSVVRFRKSYTERPEEKRADMSHRGGRPGFVQVLDENSVTIGVAYPGDTLEIGPDDVTHGNHVYLFMRTQPRDRTEAGMDEEYWT